MDARVFLYKHQVKGKGKALLEKVHHRPNKASVLLLLHEMDKQTIDFLVSALFCDVDKNAVVMNRWNDPPLSEVVENDHMYKAF